MNTRLISALKEISEIDFIQLDYRMQTSKWVRGIIKQYKLTDEQMAKQLGLTKVKFKHFKNAAYDYSIRDWAKLQAVEMELGIEVLKKEVDKHITVHSEPKP